MHLSQQGWDLEVGTASPIILGRRPRKLVYSTGLALLAVGAGTAIAQAGRSQVFLAISLAVLLGLAGFAGVLSASSRGLTAWLICSVVLQNAFVIDIGFWILPTYLLVVLVWMRVLGDSRLTPIQAPMTRPVKAFLALGAVSTLVAVNLHDQFAQPQAGLRYTPTRPFIQFGTLVLVVSAYFLVLRLVRSGSHRARALRVLVVAGTVIALYALYQQFAYYLDLPGLNPPLGIRAANSAYLLGGSFVFRSNATFFEPLNLGHFLVGIIPVTIALSLGRPASSPITRRWLVAATALQVLALVSTFSAGAYGGLAVAFVALLIIVKRRGRVLGFLAAGLLVVFLLLAALTTRLGREISATDLLGSRFSEVLSAETARSTNPFVVGSRRIDYWAASFRLLQDYPLTGVGIGNFGFAVASTNSRLRFDAGSYGVLWAWMGEFGILGVALFLYFVTVYVRTMWAGYRAHSSVAPELSGFLAAFMGMMVQYFSYGYTRLDVHFWLLLGLSMSTLRLAGREIATRPG